jgi:hypothetical protein
MLGGRHTQTVLDTLKKKHFQDALRSDRNAGIVVCAPTGTTLKVVVQNSLGTFGYTMHLQCILILYLNIRFGVATDRLCGLVVRVPGCRPIGVGVHSASCG